MDDNSSDKTNSEGNTEPASTNQSPLLQPKPPAQPAVEATQTPDPVQPVSNPAENQSVNQPMPGSYASPTAMAEMQKGSPIKKIIGLVLGVLGVGVLGLMVLGMFVKTTADLGATENREFSSSEPYAYSLDTLTRAEVDTLEESVVASTSAGHISTSFTDDRLINAVSYVIVEDLGVLSGLTEDSLSKQDIYDIYLSGESDVILENVVASTLALDDVDLVGEIRTWSNANFSDGIQADLTAETQEGVELKGHVVFTADSSGKYGYTMASVAPNDTWNDNTDLWKQIELSLRKS